MSVKSEIEQYPYLLNLARNLHYGKPGATLLDLRQELERSLEVVNGLIARYGAGVKLNDASRQQSS